MELDIGSGEPTFAFTQDGETLTGTCQGTFGEAEVSGTGTGNEIEFRFGGQLGDAVYTGTIDGNMKKGTCDYGGLGEGRGTRSGSDPDMPAPVRAERAVWFSGRREWPTRTRSTGSGS